MSKFLSILLKTLTMEVLLEIMQTDLSTGANSDPGMTEGPFLLIPHLNPVC
jgi:hypothetical protein